tara:strand:- start:5 stop:940 length:936 start_codon:yes stop_codon:yes gene_type:complete
MKNLKKIIIVLISFVALYSAFILVSDINTIYDNISNFKIEFLPIIFPLIFFGWFLLFLRWNLLLKNSNIHIPFKDSFLIYYSSFAFSFIPGEVGSLVKSKILKNKFNIPITKTSPIVISEFIYTGIGLVFLSLFLGGLYFEYGLYIGGIFSIFLFIMFFMINSKNVFRIFLRIASKIKFISSYATSFENSFDNIKKSTSGKVAVYSTLLSISHLLIESSAVFLIIYAYGIETVFILDIIPMYCTSILLGFVSFLPLGLGVVEGAFSAFLNLRGIELAVALPLVIIIRLITNWFGILLGAFTLKKYGGLTSR